MKNYASSLNNVFVFTLLLIICSVIPLQNTDGQTVLNNDLLRFGTGGENSVNTTGNLQQPFYYNSTLALWRKLTYSTYPLDNSFAIGGNGTSEWNLNGTIVENPSMTGQVIDLSGYIPTTSPNGYGTIISRGTITISSSNLEIENKYELEVSQAFIKVTTKVKNVSGATVSNVRFWIGTRDDYVGGTDQPMKEKGNLVDGAFAKITNQADRALALRISTAAEGVLFYTNSTKGNNIINACCSWTNVTNQNPLTSTIEITNDGSYGFYVRMNDLTNGSSDEFTWYYAAGKLADLETIISAVAAASGAVSDISYTTATFKAKSSSSGTGYYMVVPRNATAPTEVQIKAGVNYGAVTVAATGSGAMTASVDKYFSITGLNGGTNYDLYFVSEDATPAFSSIAKVQFVTIENTVPVVSTNATISDVLTTTASSGGNITMDGGLAVTGRGVCWSTSANPTTSNSVTTNGTGTGSFTSSLTGLTPGTLHYLKAYATNSMGTGYGSQITFITYPSDPSSASATSPTIFIGLSSVLTATGAQGSVKWYTGSCGGTLAGTGNPLTLSPTVTTTYYARNYANSLYSLGCASVTVTVNKYNQTITFVPIPGKTYGDADFSPASASSGLAIFYSSSNTAVATVVAGKVHIVGVGSSDITASQAGNATYNPAISATQTLSVSKASLTVTANNKSKTYGASEPVLDYTVSGTLFNGDAYSVVTGVTLSTVTGAAAFFGTHTITAADGSANNYDITHVNGTLTVSKAAALTVTANNKAKVYGATDPVLDYTATGTLYYTDAYSVISGVSLNAVTGTSASFGTHTITASGGTATNYNITHVNGTLTVSKASLTVTANNKAKVYGATDPTLDYTSSGTLYYTDGYSVISGVSLSTTTGAAASFGTHSITAAGGSANNYNVNHVNGSLTVSKASLTVTANDKAKVYGATDPTLDYTPSGTLYYTDGYSVISGVSLNAVTDIAASFGSHTITASGGSANNYNVNHVNGTLTVSKAAALTVTANNKAKVYGATDPVLDYTATGTLYYTDTYSVISGVSLNAVTGTSASFGTHTITASGGTATNYNITHVNGTLTVSKASLTVTANDKVKVYGATDPILDYTSSGTLYYTDGYSVISGVSLNAVTGAAASFGTHSITAAGGSANNYTVNHVNGTLTVSKAAALTVIANDKSKIYGASDPVLDYTVTGTLYNGDSYSVVTGVTLSTAIGASATYDVHTITASGGTATNYNITHVNGTLTVSKASLTVTANNKTKVYGTSDPVLDYTSSGTLFYTDTWSVITGVSLSTTTGAAASFGSHAITAAGGSADNYDVTHVNGTLTVNKAALSVTANDKSKVYGASDPVLDYTPSGTLYYSDAYSVISGVTLSTTTGAAASFGSHAITAAGGSADNYNVTHVNGTLTVNKAALTVTANDKSKVYGASDPVLDFTPSGILYYSDAYSVISGVTLSTTTGAAASFGSHAINASGGSADNYNVNHVNGSLTVSKASLTVTANDKTKVYGEANPSLTFQYSGWLNGDDSEDLATKPSVSTTVLVTSPVDVYSGAITVADGADENYSFSYTPADFTVTKAILSVTADAKTKVYGEANPALSFQYSGWLNGDDSEDLATIPSVSTTVSVISPVNVYSGAITVADGADENYSFSYTPADLTVTKATLSVTADAKTKVYGEANPSLTFQYSGWLNGDDSEDLATKPSASTTVSVTSPIDFYSGAITVADGADENYSFSYTPADFAVTKATLTVTADAKTKVYGEANPALTFQYSGWLNGDDAEDLATKPSASTTVSVTSPVDVYSGAITVADGADENYSFSYTPADFTVTKATLTVTADAKTKVYGDANPTLTFQYSGWVNGVETIDLAPSITTTVDETTSFGTYTDAITLSGGLDNNYTFSFVTGALDLTKAILTATAEPKTKVYGSDNPVLTISWAGLKNNDEVTVINELPLISTLALKASDIGIYDITISGGDDNNYDLNLVNGSLNIDKAPLVIMAEDKAKTYLEPNPELTFTWSGFVLGQNQDVIDVVPALETIANENSDAGTYDIIASGGVDGNYSFTYENGTLAIDKADQVITFEEIPAGLRTTQDHQLIAETTSGLSITFETSDPIIGSIYGSLLSVNKEGNLTITASQPGNQNWNPAQDISREIVTLPTFDNLNSLFTPNNDGMNDYWYIPDLEKYGRLQVTVYNRFGQKVYGSDGYKNDWDGTWNGYPLPSASYYYIMKSSAKGYIKGVVNLVR